MIKDQNGKKEKSRAGVARKKDKGKKIKDKHEGIRDKEKTRRS